MAERLDNYNLLPYNSGNFENGKIAKVHPTLDCPDGLSDHVLLALDLEVECLTPTGLRTLALPRSANGTNSLIVAKGYFPSPVHVYGERAADNQRKWLHHFQKQGEFGGRAQMTT